MAKLETWYKQDLKRPLVVHKHTDVFNQDSKGNLIGVEVYSDGEPVALSGSISGYCLLADGTTVPAVGASRSGNKASVLIPQTAYSVPGPITITIKNVEGDNITTLCATVGIVRQSVSGNLVNPGSVVTDWSNNINAQLQAVQTAVDNVGAIVAVPFDENTVYVVGNYVTNNGNLYRITAYHAAGVAWANTAKVQCTVGHELEALNNHFIANRNLIDPEAASSGKTDFIPVELNVRYNIIHAQSKGQFQYGLSLYDSNKEMLYIGQLVDEATDGTNYFYSCQFSQSAIAYVKIKINSAPSGIDTTDFSKVFFGKGSEYIEFDNYNVIDLINDVSDLKSALGTVPSGKTVQGQIDDNANDISDLKSALNSNESQTFNDVGYLSMKDFTVPKGSTQKQILSFDMKSGDAIVVDIKLKTAIGTNTYFYLQTADGTNLLPSTSYSIAGTNTTGQIRYTANADYTNAVLKYTIAGSASRDAELESVVVTTPIPASSDLLFVGEHTTISKQDFNTKLTEYPIVYKADEIVAITTTEKFTGIQMILSRFPVGVPITLKANRDGGNGWICRIDFLDANGTRIGAETVSMTGEQTRIIPDETNNIRLTVAASWNTSMDIGTTVTFTDVEVSYSQAEEAPGTNAYTGEKIVLSDEPENKDHYCKIDLWKDFTSSEISGLANYRLDKNQSLTIYKDYVFLFQEGGGILILNYSTKGIISESSFELTRYQHANSAQFTDLWYSTTDEFPLLLISRCGNMSDALTGYDEVLIYRVMRSGTAFTFDLVNRIYCDLATKGSSWGIDNITNTLYMVGSKSGWWESGDKQDVEFMAWHMPSLSSIKAGEPLTLQRDSAIAYMSIPFITLQGLAVKSGVVYAGFSVSGSGQFVYAVDVFKGRILSKIPLIRGYEVEGVAVYNGLLYVSQKNGADTVGTNPCKIYELTF